MTYLEHIKGELPTSLKKETIITGVFKKEIHKSNVMVATISSTILSYNNNNSTLASLHALKIDALYTE